VHQKDVGPYQLVWTDGAYVQLWFEFVLIGTVYYYENFHMEDVTFDDTSTKFSDLFVALKEAKIIIDANR
jgi:hypothetical protein